jgi:hypothetical protein
MRAFTVVVLAIGALALAACNKPSEADCRRAVQQIRELTGTADIQAPGTLEAAVRSCKGNATRASVKCAMEASSLEQLGRCGLLSPEEVEALQPAAPPPPPPPPPAADAAPAEPAADAGAAEPAGAADAAEAASPEPGPE